MRITSGPQTLKWVLLLFLMAILVGIPVVASEPMETRAFQTDMLQAGGISPTTASPSSVIRYNVTYYGLGAPRDSTGAIKPPEVHIDGGLVVEMVLDESAPAQYNNGVYSDGESYYINVAASKIAEVGVTEHTYYFSVSDGTDDGRYPDNGTLYGPDFIPELSFGGVDPTTGDTLTTFRYSVVYADVSGQDPQWVRVAIDGTYHDMEVDDGNPNEIRTGEVYSYTTTLDAGSHNFSFSARSNIGAAAIGDNWAHNGPVVEQGDLPDLTITANNIWFSKDLLQGGDSVGISARVYNVGKVPAPTDSTVNVTIWRGNPDDTFSPGVYIGHTLVPGSFFAVNAYYEVSHILNPIPTNGEYKIYVTVDRDVVRADGKGTVDEIMDYGSVFSNNKAYKILRAGPDLEIAAISPPSVIKGQTFKFVIKITNTGAWDATVPVAGIPVNVRYAISGLLIMSVTIFPTSQGVDAGLIHPGDIVTVWGEASLPAEGEWAVAVEVDTGMGIGQVDEIVEFDADSSGKADPGTNNRAEYTVDVVTGGGRNTPSFWPMPVGVAAVVLMGVVLNIYYRRKNW